MYVLHVQCIYAFMLYKIGERCHGVDEGYIDVRV